MKTVAVIPSAGSGRRMGTEIKKQYLSLSGMPVLAWTLKAFQDADDINEIIVVVPADDLESTRQDIVEKYGIATATRVVAGGRLRFNSVFAGLQSIEGTCDVVVIHDGVRPLITPQLIKKAVNTARHFGAALVATPAVDTIKQMTEDGYVKWTPDRRTMYNAQTPQAFEYNLIMDAYRDAIKHNIESTDDCQLVERLGAKIVVVEGSIENIKITTDLDLVLAEYILAKRKERPFE